jgi:hypothetical protein
MDAERKRQLKARGKAEVERRSAELRKVLAAANPASIDSVEWGANYKKGVERERWLRERLPLLDSKQLQELFVILPNENDGWHAHIGSYVVCQRCGSAVPAALPRRLFYWAGCECKNVRWRCILFWQRVFVSDPSVVIPVKLVGKA